MQAKYANIRPCSRDSQCAKINWYFLSQTMQGKRRDCLVPSLTLKVFSNLSVEKTCNRGDYNNLFCAQDLFHQYTADLTNSHNA